jgi:gluconate 5-dehydrogenase
MHPLFSLDGKIALVTGASRGLGWAMAEGLAEANAMVVLNGRIEATLHERARALTARKLRADVLAFDVTDERLARAGVAEVVKRHGRIDILLANAGMMRRRPLAEWTVEDFNALIAANLTSCFVLAQAAAADMTQRGHGRIIFTTSLTALRGRAGIHGYVAAKSGLAGLVRSLAAELGASNITVNGIMPGYFETELTAALLADPAFVEWVHGRTPMQRWGKPRELAGAAIYLASEAASFVNGQQIVVDGGLSTAM